MKPEFSEFEGKTVQAGVLRFSGRAAERVGTLAQDEFAIVIAKVRVTKVSHADFRHSSGSNSARLYSRIHDTTVVRSVVLGEEQGARMLEEAINLADENFGVVDLFSAIQDANDKAERAIFPDGIPKADDKAWDDALAEINAEGDEPPLDDPEDEQEQITELQDELEGDEPEPEDK